MTETLVPLIALAWLVIGVICWLGWQLLRQNGRILLRLDEVERQLDELEFGEAAEPEGLANGQTADQVNARPHPQGEIEAQDRASRFGNRSLARSKIKRDGLKAGTSAPSFRLPRLDDGELSLEELRGKRALLVFSDPHCGPCNVLAPQLEKFHRENGTKARSPSLLPSPPGAGERPPAVEVVIISRGDPKENCAKVKEHGLTLPVVLQQRWEISRRYAMFATPMAYLIDESGVIVKDVAVGVEPILNLMAAAKDGTLQQY